MKLVTNMFNWRTMFQWGPEESDSLLGSVLINYVPTI
jgi:hypothetical protein